MEDLIVLPEPPSLPREFARALLTRGRAGARGEVPQTRIQSTVRPDRDHLIAYQRLCGYRVDDFLPHTYPHVAAFGLQVHLMADADFPLPMLGMVHIANATTAHRPISADAELTVSVHAEGLAPHPKGVTVDLVAEATVDGETAWSSRSTYLHRTSGRSDAPVAAIPDAPAGPPTALWRLSGDLGRRYAAVAGDVNPIHLHPWTAKALGFPRAIAHGMWTYARTAAAMGVQGAESTQVWFRKPVLLPSKVALRESSDGRVVALTAAKDADTVHLVMTRSAVEEA